MTIVLEPIGIRRNGRWEGIHWRMDVGGTSDIEIEHSVEDSWAGLLPDPTNADHILPATLLYAMKGSEEPYDQLIFPWGATPLTIPLISTERLPVTEDGCGYDRSDKVSYISRNTRASDHIRVCWAGNQMDRNCGECEKCIRTMLNYWANGLGVPDSFPTTLTPDLVKTIVLRNEGQAAHLGSIRHAASRRDILNTSIGRAIDTVLFRHRLRSLLNAPRSFVSRVKQRIKFHVQSITKR